MKRFLTFFYSIILSLYVFPQNPPEVEWSKTFPGTGMDWGYGAIQTSDGGYALTTRIDHGSLNFDARLIKTNSSGDTLWSKSYGSTYIDETYQVKQLSNGGYILCGVSTQFGNAGEAWLVKTDAQGNVVWSKGYHTSQSTTADWEYFYDMVENSDGSITAAGYAYLGGLEWQAWLVKVNSSGTMVWNKLYGGQYWERLFALKATNDGGYIAVGDKHVAHGDTTSHDGWLLKFNSSGDTAWTKLYGDSQIDIFRSVDLTSDGGYIISGEREPVWGQGFKGWLVKTDASGNVVFNNTLTLGGLMSVLQTTNGYIAAGTRSTPENACEGWVIRTDNNGTILWNKFINESPLDEVINTIQRTADGGYIIGGRDYSSSDAGYGWLVKLGPDVTPVELNSFTADVNGGSVMIKWSTATETNNRHFEIQRSSNGSDFTTISIVPGNATTTQKNYYTYEDNNISGGAYWYRLRQIDFDGSSQYSEVLTVFVSMPGQYMLSQNYPNPFNPSTTISYTIPEAGKVTLRVFDMLGNEAAALRDEYQTAGKYEINFDGKNLSSGTYIYKLTVNNFTESKKMILMK